MGKGICYVNKGPYKDRSTNVCVFAIMGGSNLGRECMPQLDMTANTVLSAITPTVSWVVCVTATVTDTHQFRHGQRGKS